MSVSTMVEDNKMVSIDYTLRNDAGEILDSTADKEPLSFLQGSGSLIPGLEEALLGKATGESFQLSLEPENAYGPRDPALVLQVPRNEFQGVEGLHVGMMLQARTQRGVQIFEVKEVGEETVTVDGNHPLSGERLHFDVTVNEVREPTEEELSPGGSCCGGGHHKEEDSCCGGHGHKNHHKEEDSCCGGHGHGHGHGGGHCHH